MGCHYEVATLMEEVKFPMPSGADEPVEIYASDLGIHMMDDLGVTEINPVSGKGLFYRFRLTHPKSGTQVHGAALGPKNLQFRREEAERNGWIFEALDE